MVSLGAGERGNEGEKAGIKSDSVSLFRAKNNGASKVDIER